MERNGETSQSDRRRERDANCTQTHTHDHKNKSSKSNCEGEGKPRKEQQQSSRYQPKLINCEEESIGSRDACYNKGLKARRRLPLLRDSRAEEEEDGDDDAE